MTEISFASKAQYRTKLASIDFWWPKIIQALNENNFSGSYKQEEVICGDNPTYPVFIIDNLVIKFFGFME